MAATNSPADSLRIMSVSSNVFGDHADPIVDDLQKPASNLEPVTGPALAHDEGSLAEQRHERSVVRQDADLAVVRGRDHRIGLAVKHGRLGRNHRDLHHALASLRAFSTASSMPPTM